MDQVQQPWQNFRAAQEQLRLLFENCMVEGIHYGKVVGDKPSLLKPGGELLRAFYDLEPKFSVAVQNMDWGTGGAEPIFYFRYECELVARGKVVGHGFGSANSREPKYRYRWMDYLPSHMSAELCEKRTTTAEVFEWQYEKREVEGQYGKPDAYWAVFDEAIEDRTVERFEKEKPWKKGEFDTALRVVTTKWRVPNPDIGDYINTIEKMAMKRAFMGAILMAAGGSQFFTQDVEDIGEMGGVQEWRPTFTQFFHRVAPSIPNLLTGATTDKEKGAVVSNLFKSTYKTEKFDPSLATEAHNAFIELDKKAKDVVEDEAVAMAPKEAFMWLAKLADDATHDQDKDHLSHVIEQLSPGDDATTAQWIESYDLLLKDIQEMGINVEAPMILRKEDDASQQLADAGAFDKPQPPSPHPSDR